MGHVEAMSVDKDFAEAVDAYQAGRFDEARAICKKGLSQQPDNHAFLNLLGSIEYRLKHYAAAKQFVEKAFRIAPQGAYRDNLISISAQLAREYLLAGDRAAAVPCYREVLKSPNLSERDRKGTEDIIADTEMVMALLQSGIDKAEIIPAAATDDFVGAIRGQISAPISGPAVVFFHVELGEGHPFARLQGHRQETDYGSALRYAVLTARRTNPAATAVILTDEHTDTSQCGAECVVIRLPIANDQLMHTRMLSYAALANSGMVAGPLAFLDSDVCLNDSLDRVFGQRFDIGLTHRLTAAKAHIPINGGVILAANSGAAAKFLGICLGLYEAISEHEAVRQRYDFNVKRWGGDQFALGAFTQWKVPPQRKDVESIRGLSCRFFPCGEYNYAVGERDTVETLRDKWAIHFKGFNKHLMPQLIVTE